MNSVFILQHVNIYPDIYPDGQEDVKLIGVYRSSEAAQAMIEQLKVKPGFREHPTLVDLNKDADESGFFIDQYELDKNHWSEGFAPNSNV